MPKRSDQLVVEQRIFKIIMIVRGEKVILDSDLATLYGVETRRLNEQVRRNIEKFPEDLMFQLNKDEFANLKSQIATSNSGWGGRRVKIGDALHISIFAKPNGAHIGDKEPSNYGIPL